MTSVAHRILDYTIWVWALAGTPPGSLPVRSLRPSLGGGLSSYGEERRVLLRKAQERFQRRVQQVAQFALGSVCPATRVPATPAGAAGSRKQLNASYEMILLILRSSHSWGFGF